MKSRHQREVGELKEQLHRANMASERDQALREKVFNEAKVEVMTLSKKVILLLLVFLYITAAHQRVNRKISGNKVLMTKFLA